MRLLLLKIKSTVHVWRSTVRNDKYDRKGKEVDVILKKKFNDKNLSFTDNVNINPRMLNKSGLHLNEYGTTQLIIFGNVWRSDETKSTWAMILEEKKITYGLVFGSIMCNGLIL